MTPLARETLRLALEALGVREERGPNRGRWVRVYQRWAGIAEGLPWCVAFALYKVHQAARRLGIRSRLPRTGSSSSLYRWYRTRGLVLTAARPGCVGMLRGGPTGHRHTFLVEEVEDDCVRGVDGNWRDAVAVTLRPASLSDYGPIV